MIPACFSVTKTRMKPNLVFLKLTILKPQAILVSLTKTKIKKIVQTKIEIPASSAPIERVFSTAGESIPLVKETDYSPVTWNERLSKLTITTF